MKRLALLAAVMLFAAQETYALDPTRPLDLYALDVWREGLPQYMVRTVVQTRDGYLWAGTMEGVVRFNGIEFEVFDTRNTPAFADQRIHTMYEDRAGTLWIGTFSGGAIRERNGAFTRLTMKDGLASDDAVAIRETRDGSIWIGGDGALTRIRGSQFTRFAAKDGLPQGAINAIAEDAQGTLWIGSEKGLYRFSGRSFAQVRPDSIPSLTVSRDGTVWAGTASDRIFRIAPNGTIDTITTGEPTLYVNDLLEDSRGTMWISTSPTGLLRYRQGRFDHLDKSQGLPSNALHGLLEDREGSLWIGTDGGLARLKDLKFVNYTTRHGLSDDAIRVVTEARGGGMWVGTYGGGLNLLRDGKVTAYGAAEGLKNLFIRTMCEEPNGDLWIGTDRGVSLLHDGKITALPEPAGKIDALARLRDGTILISTSGGVWARRSGGALSLAYPLTGNSEPRVILERTDGSLWLGTYAGLVDVTNNLRWTTREGLPSNMVFALHEDPNGDLWIGTHDGLARMRKGRIDSITTREGLPDGVVFQIIDDARGHFWLTSPRGLSRIDRESIDEVFARRTRTVRAMSFGKYDGLGSDQCNGATQPAGARLSDGRLAIPTAAGLTIVDPADLHLNRVSPGIVLREVLVDGKRIAPDAKLPWSSKRYEFRYDGLSLLMPQLVRFRYRIDGFDSDWIDAGTRRVAFYNSLPPGDHRFRVAAINNDGVWSEDATIAFSLPPPPWQRWWAIAAYLLLFAGFVALIILWRERRVRIRTEELERKVHERTVQLEEAESRANEANRAKSVFLANMSHELRTPLNAVIGFAQLMARSRSLTDADRENLSIIRRGGEHLLGLINDVLSISKIEAGKMTAERRPFDVYEMIDGVAGMIRARTDAAGLALVVDVTRTFPPVVSGDEGKLRQVLINLLGNAVKFTERGTITIRGSWSGGRALFEVSDTGHGIGEDELSSLFQPFVQTATGLQAKEGTGLGLVITQQLIRLMDGDITVYSRRGSGTTFRFDLEMPAAAERAVQHQTRRVIGLAPGQRKKIEVVDDTLDNRTLLRRLLESVGFEVRDAANGQDGVDLWKAWRPDLIFMDQRMPVMDGSEATRLIRRSEEEEALPRTKIIALTASAFEHERDAILNNGADEFVVKPFAEETIFESLGRNLGVRYLYEGDQIAAGNRVLLVDDDEITRIVASEVLAQLGCVVSEAEDGASALEMLERETFDAVLMDMEMPGLDGRATIREIRSRERLRALPVIAMTSHDRSEAAVEGITDYISKPVNEQEMAKVLGQYMQVPV